MDKTIRRGDAPPKTVTFPVSSTSSALDNFDHTLRDELSKRAAKDNEIIEELEILRQNLSQTQQLREENGRLQHELASAKEELRLQSRADTPPFEDLEEQDRCSRLLQELDKMKRKFNNARREIADLVLEKSELKQALDVAVSARHRISEEFATWRQNWEQAKRKRAMKKAAGIDQSRSSSVDQTVASTIRHPGETFPHLRQPQDHSTTKIPLDAHSTPPRNSPSTSRGVTSREQSPKKRVVAREYKPVLQNRDSDDRTDDHSAYVHHSSPILPPLLLESFGNADTAETASDPRGRWRDVRKTQSSISTSSQNSQIPDIGDDTTLIAINDSPQFVSTRSVKRKRDMDDTGQSRLTAKSGVRGRGSPGSPVQVKSEGGSSSPLIIMRPQVEQSNSQVLDLDDVGGRVPTPRKHDRFVRQALIHGGAVPIQLDRTERSLVRATSEPASVAASQSQRLQDGTSAVLWSEKSTPLQPVDPNKGYTRKLDRSMKKAWRPYRRRDISRGEAAIPLISEDGEFSQDSTSRRDKTGKSRGTGIDKPSEEECQARLGTLLEKPSLARTSLTPHTPALDSLSRSNYYKHISLAVAPKASSLAEQPRFVHTRTEVCHSPDHQSIASKKVMSTSYAQEKPGFSLGGLSSHSPSSRPTSSRSRPIAKESKIDHVPFRNLQLEDLMLSHFKVNPTANQGLSFAFKEVVRGREERKCLPGCTLPECCGTAFRQMVELGGLPVRPEQRLWDSDDLDDEQRLIEQETGWTKAKIASLNETERQRILIDAKIRKVAKQFGKHRHAHERAPSPPGFWRTEFPSTQELREDRAQADLMEKNKIWVRYREAMRAGGLWKFADE